jgi:hypothetical protein
MRRERKGWKSGWVEGQVFMDISFYFYVAVLSIITC